MKQMLTLGGPLLLVLAGRVAAQEAVRTPQIAATLKQISPHVAAEAEREQLRSMLGRSLREQIAAANRASTEAWARIQTREDWERFRLEKLASLRKSLGELPSRPAKPRTLVTGRLQGEGFQIHNLVYESRPGLVVTANLYLPDPPRDSMPGILLSHSHHNPKDQGELQDMGMTWARAGCYVLVPDHLGHGERRQHSFATSADYAGEFQLGRQDYYFRYDTSLQLYLVGESLMGWMVHDLMTGVDLLLAQPGIDRQRIILLGSVAAGGDSAAVTAALDERIACVVPFNFGGPQPETHYPLPVDAETSFNYAGSGSWESTRNLYRSAADGFLPWVIVGSVAPRHLIHAHEFSWDRESDPVWKRYQKIWSLYEASDHLAFTHGHGTLTGTDPPGSHCNNIGPVQRRQIHEALRRWFNIEVKPEDEYTNRRTREELTCLTDEAKQQVKPKMLHEILAAMALKQIATARDVLEHVSAAERRGRIAKAWTGYVTDQPREDWRMQSSAIPEIDQPEPVLIECRRIVVSRGENAASASPSCRAVILLRKQDGSGKRPLVIAIASEGPAGFLKHRERDLAELLTRGAAIALIDVSGTGGLSAGEDHGPQSSETSQSATQLMLGTSLLGRQLHDLRSMMNAFSMEFFVDVRRIYVWGDSFARPLPAEAMFQFPRRVDRPAECNATGPLLALLLAATTDDVAGVCTRGGLVSYESVLESPFVQVSHADIVPGVLQHADLPDLVAMLAPRPAILEGLVDGRNRRVPAETAAETYHVARAAYANRKAAEKLIIRDASDNKSIVEILSWPDESESRPLPPK